MQKKDQRKGRRRQNKRPQRERIPFDKEAWQPKTELGRKVKSGEIKNVDEIQNLMSKIIGKSLIPKSSGTGKDSSIEGMDEVLSKPWNIEFRDKNKKTLEKDRKIPYMTLSTPERTPSKTSRNGMIGKAIRIIRPTIKEIEKKKIKYSKKKDYFELYTGFMEIKSTMNIHTYVDVFCKKGNNHYVFDVKHKTFKEDKNPNQFVVTNYEVLNYARIIKENKVKLKILIIVDKGKKSFSTTVV